MPTVTLFHTATCPYCTQAESLLRRQGAVDIHKINIEQDEAQRAQMMARTGRRTVPQIFIGDQYVGGFDELAALERSSGLAPLLLA